jgi:hypothetical protein
VGLIGVAEGTLILDSRKRRLLPIDLHDTLVKARLMIVENNRVA